MPTDIDILRKIDRIHPYPAKFPVDLAMNYISKYTNIGNTVYDPFVGSGTTLLASRALERNAYGTDVNHIAVLISQFKLLSLSQNDIKELHHITQGEDINLYLIVLRRKIKCANM